MLKAIVIDDELYAREELIALLKETQQIEIVASCHNAIEGLQKVNCLKPDVIFLDIQMPQISGLEMLSMLDPDTMPKVVFVTAYDEYALKAFEDNAFDYILKPVEPSRLAITLTRLKSIVGPTDFTPLLQKQLELIPCAGYNRILLLKPEEIELAYSDQSGVHVICSADLKNVNSTTCSLSLKVLEEKTCLIRCHRQYLVNPTAIREIKLLDNSLAEIITCNGAIAPVSRRYLKALKDRFSLS
ncbi:two-component system response regulator BtsR [Psychromonas antarctica]|jgi:two-component system LytT family response regulator|uniref:two-component system response regulator BtsR n=1 Tax=Psychromonas antarctica TaxID=67573 RepID=UPI001EE83C4A|nr:two-component system response regulator BtsR [Psychromonas antarctica]MCG6200570.1 two-component system response regulator BtsR [Psychromonas antarctica]